MGGRVRDLMKTSVRSVRPDMSLVELEGMLLRERIGGAPVVERGAVVGVVSRSDIVKHLQVEQSQAEVASTFYLEPFDSEDAGARDRERVAEAVASRRSSATVGDVMSRDLIRIGPDESVERAARLMLDRRVHRLLVMEGDALVGLVSVLDLVQLVADGGGAAA
jgi:CBS domain-containing protein